MNEEHRWHNTSGGRVLILIVGLVGILVIAFLILIGYYVFRVGFGDAQGLAEEFNPRFTSISSDQKLGSQDDTLLDAKAVIRNYNPTIGPDDAEVTVLMFIDFECPYCQESYPITAEVIDTYKPAVQFVFKHFPLAQIHPRAESAAMASMCAHEQDMFWEYYTLLFEQASFEDSELRQYASQLKLNLKAFDACMDSQTYASQIQQDLRDGIELGVGGTPTYVINNRRFGGVYTKAHWDRFILEALQ